MAHESNHVSALDGISESACPTLNGSSVRVAPTRSPSCLASAFASLASANPTLPALIGNSAFKALSVDASSPFGSDEECLNLMRAYFSAQKAMLDVRDYLKRIAVSPLVEEVPLAVGSAAQLEYLATAERAAMEAHSLALDLIRAKIEAHYFDGCKILAPRIVRISEEYDMSEKEMMALATIVFANSDTFVFTLEGGDRISSFLETLRVYCQMTMSEGLRFIDKKRRYAKESIVCIEEQDSPVRYMPQMPGHMIAVVLGGEMSTENKLKIDGTGLYAVLQKEDPNADQLADRPTSSDDVKSPEDGTPEPELKGDRDEETNIADLLRGVREEEEGRPDLEAPSMTPTVPTDNEELTPYTNNLAYLSDHFDWICLTLRVHACKKEVQEERYSRDVRVEQQLRELSAKLKGARQRCVRRMDMTRASASGWLPRLERLFKILGLDEFEKLVLYTLVGNKLSSRISPDMSYYGSSSSMVSIFYVGQLVHLFSESFEQEVMHRKYFYKNATLIREGVIQLSDSGFGGELMNTTVEVDRRMLDFIVGLDTEFNELVEGGHLYSPSVKLDQVVMNDDQKALVVETVTYFDKFEKMRRRLGFEDVISYGNGMVLLLFGQSGTGKTMLANALANKLGKKVLLINYPSLGSQADLVIKFIFREAKLTDAILFFDEAEAMFKSRDIAMNGGLNLLLTEIERHKGLIIMATNRAYDLDESMHRRVTLAIEFRLPDPNLREKIWRAHVPDTGLFAENIDWRYISIKYELTGGFIKNAMLAALSSAVSRGEKEGTDKVLITQEDVEKGAINQLRGRLAMVEFDRRVVPVAGLDGLVLATDVCRRLAEIVRFEKARQILIGEWGFGEALCRDQGTTVLLHGPPGVGKTVAAEAIGFETGKPLKIVNYAELVSKYVGDTGKNIEKVFSEAKALDVVLVFDEAEGLFSARTKDNSSSTDRYANVDTGLLLYHMERFPGIVILCTNLIDGIDPAFFRRFRFIVEFKLPDAEMRRRLWDKHLPSQAPRSADVDLAALGERFTFSGGHIKNACFKAASRAALRDPNPTDPKSPGRIIAMDDLVDCATEEDALLHGRRSTAAAHMFN
eukprot:Opistho-2@14032